MAKVRISYHNGVKYISYPCPGCGEGHSIPVSGPKAWDWDGNADEPTISPSVKTTRFVKLKQSECHHFVRGGYLQFCGDSDHDLRGQTIPMEDV